MPASSPSSAFARTGRPLRFLAGLTFLTLFSLPSVAFAKRGDSSNRVQVGIGLSSRGIDGWSFGISHDRGYRRSYPRPYFRPRYYPGYFVNTLPRYHSRFIHNSVIYYEADGICYRPSHAGYVVVDRPVIIEREVQTPVVYRTTTDGIDPNREIGAPAREVQSAKTADYVTVWQGDQELRLVDGEFFKPTAQGLVWIETPVGAVTDVLPIGFQVVWHDDIEYFRFDGVMFRKSPDGYKVVAAPWTKS